MGKNEQVAQYFKENRSAKEIHVTSDGFLFPQKKYALDHANSLEENKREVETFSNPYDIEVVETPEIPEPVELTAEQKELLENGLVKENYQDLKALVNVLNLEPENYKAETLIAVLEAYKSK